MKDLKRTLASAAVGLVMLSACSNGSVSAEDVKGDLVVGNEVIADVNLYKQALGQGTLQFYTGGSDQSEQLVAEKFTEDTGIPVELIRLAPAKLTERILSEHSANKLAADVIRISGADLLQSLVDNGVFQAHNVPDSFALDDTARVKDGLYYRSFDRIYTFAYNNQIVSADQAPSSWAALIDPKWRGQLGIVQVSAGGAMAALTRFHFEKLGEKYLREFAGENPRTFDTVSSLVDALARGEIKVGTVPIATAYGAISEGAPLGVGIPSDGMAAFPYYVGISSSTSRLAAAQVFENWLLSARGQELAGTIGDYPVRSDVGAPKVEGLDLPPADSPLIYRHSPEESLRHLESDATLWKEIFGYVG
ncbi:extracellular solute-binding protein [Micromonospora sp. NPDC005206]|uniref:ABC transporter substrate-binding protein n=1 Tax=Micromonospora sp. NPDC005206 TaxID=3157022 RepID=UPI0033A7DD2D